MMGVVDEAAGYAGVVQGPCGESVHYSKFCVNLNLLWKKKMKCSFKIKVHI